MSYVNVVDTGSGALEYTITRLDNAIKYHAKLGSTRLGSVLRFTDDRAYLGWYATPDDCTGGPNSTHHRDYRWSGGFRTRREAIAHLRGHANARSAWWAESAANV